MRETSKATARRLQDREFWDEVFSGTVIDVGSGDDLMQWPNTSVSPFDVGDGDANLLHEVVGEKTFDVVHASQCLEHMHDVFAALRSWSRVARKYLVFTVPDFVYYEKLRFPSMWNPDHKSTWSDYVPRSPALGRHVFIPRFLETVAKSGLGEPVLAGLRMTSYDYSLGPDVDQTLDFEKGVECFHEFVIRVP